MTEIRKPKQEKDQRRTSNAQHRTSNVGVALLRIFNKIETPRAYHNSMLEVRFLIRFWSRAAQALAPRVEYWNLRFI